MSTIYVDNLQPNLGSQVIIPQLKPLAGSVLQVVEGSSITQVEGSFSSATSLGVSAAITPTSTSSKILVLVNLTGCGSRDTSTHWRAELRRDSTDLCSFSSYTGATFASGGEAYVSGSYLDAPTTTSSVTYAMYGRRNFGSANCYAIHNDSTNPRQRATITLMEIAQ